MITEKASFFNFPQGVDVGMRRLRSGTRRLSLEYLAYAIRPEIQGRKSLFKVSSDFSHTYRPRTTWPDPGGTA